MVLYNDVSSPLDRSKRFTLSSPGRPVHSDTVLGSMVASHNGSQKKLFRLHEPSVPVLESSVMGGPEKNRSRGQWSHIVS